MSPTEKEWQLAVNQLLALHGWRSYHTFDSRRSSEGFPDVIALKPPRMLAVELKTDKGKPTQAQLDWLNAFAGVDQVEAHIWVPRGLDAIMEILA